MRRGLIVCGVLAALLIADGGPARAQDDDPLTRRLREAAAETTPPPAPPSLEAPATIEGGLPPGRIRARIAEELGVEVLDVQAAETADGPAYAVKVMNPPGDSNSALMVGMLLVDPATGNVLGRAERFPTFSESVPLVRDPEVDAGGPELRRRTYR